MFGSIVLRIYAFDKDIYYREEKHLSILALHVGKFLGALPILLAAPVINAFLFLRFKIYLLYKIEKFFSSCIIRLK